MMWAYLVVGKIDGSQGQTAAKKGGHIDGQIVNAHVPFKDRRSNEEHT
jgi:hypothetical protein